MKISQMGIPLQVSRALVIWTKAKFFSYRWKLYFRLHAQFSRRHCSFLFKVVFQRVGISKLEYGLNADFINKRISSFHYGSSDSSDKPSAKFTDANLRVQGNYSIKQRAAQILCLMRNFPLMFGDIIPTDDPHYGFLLFFLQIMDIVFAPAITSAHIHILRDYIFLPFEKFNLLFPNLQPINKMHPLIHYPDIIRWHGPPTRYWCMRFEAFHYVIKRRAQFIGNYINICNSLASHIQRLQCINLMDDELVSTKGIFGQSKFFHFPDIDQQYQVFTAWLNFKSWSLNFHSKLGNTRRVEILLGGILVLKKCFEIFSGLPKFGKIKSKMVQHDTNIFIDLSVLRTVDWVFILIKFFILTAASRFPNAKLFL